MQVYLIIKGSDKLVQKNRFPFEFKTVEFYEKAFGISDPKTNRAYKIDDILFHNTQKEFL